MAQLETRSYGRWIIAVVALGALVWGFMYYRARSRVVTVHAALVERQDIRQTVSTNGKVEPTEDFQAHAPMAGVVSALYVEQGDQVKAGQELVRMDDTEAIKQIAAAQAALDSAQATLQALQKGGTADERLAANNDMTAAESQQRQAAATLASLQKLQAQGAASANEVATAAQRLSDAQTRIGELKARRTGRYASDDIKAQQAQVAQARASLVAAQQAYAGVVKRAPFSGVVYSVPVSQYDFVQAGDTLLDVADLSRLQIRAYFDEPEIGNLAIGQPVKIVWDAKPSAVWHGHILQAPTTIIQYGATRNVGECIITVDDARGDLLPNTNVTVTVTTQQHNDVLSLPREALQTDGARNFVYRIVGDRLLKTPVVPGLVTLTRVEISSGLNAGDQVALGTTSESDMNNGLRVKVQPQ
jgi:HlyD family secretion protein